MQIKSIKNNIKNKNVSFQSKTIEEDWMSELIVEICKIEEILPHENADRLELATIKGWICVIQKNSFNVGDLCLYIPIDSILPEELESKIFGTDSKIKLDKHRIRTIKLRGIISQGLVVKPEVVGINKYKLGQDFTSELEITKYEPPQHLPSAYGKCNQVKKMYINSNFNKYTDIANIKNHPKVFEDGEQVYISEKLHGTSFRCGWVENEANTYWKKIKKFFGLLDKYEFIWGSRNVQLSSPKYEEKCFYDENIYAKTVKWYDLKNKLQHGEVLYGEIVGHGVQKGYEYGCIEGETRLYAYDIMKDNKWLDYIDFTYLCGVKRIPKVPTLFIGNYSKNLVEVCTRGSSVIDSIGVPIREGVVIKPIKELRNPYVGRKVLKSINLEYLLLKDNSEFH